MPLRPEALARPSVPTAGAASTALSSLAGLLGISPADCTAFFFPLVAAAGGGAGAAAEAAAAGGGCAATAASGGGVFAGSGGTIVAIAGVMTFVTPGPAETAGKARPARGLGRLRHQSAPGGADGG